MFLLLLTRPGALALLQENSGIVDKINRRNMVLYKILRRRSLFSKNHAGTWTVIYVVYHTTYILIQKQKVMLISELLVVQVFIPIDFLPIRVLLKMCGPILVFLYVLPRHAHEFQGTSSCRRARILRGRGRIATYKLLSHANTSNRGRVKSRPGGCPAGVDLSKKQQMLATLLTRSTKVGGGPTGTYPGARQRTRRRRCVHGFMAQMRFICV